jgi:hypothetical protein
MPNTTTPTPFTLNMLSIWIIDGPSLFTEDKELTLSLRLSFCATLNDEANGIF